MRANDRSARSWSECRFYSRRHIQTLAAQNYIDGHNVLSWIQDLLQDLIHEWPSDPWDFINKHAVQKCGAESVIPGTTSIQTTAVTQVADPAENALGVELDVETIRKQVQDVLMGISDAHGATDVEPETSKREKHSWSLKGGC